VVVVVVPGSYICSTSSGSNMTATLRTATAVAIASIVFKACGSTVGMASTVGWLIGKFIVVWC
jgi:hypothetical protein